jgi:hypothetical protein
VKDDPLRERILDELRELRRGRGAMSLERIAFATSLIEDFGRGSVEQGYTALLDLLDRHGADAESDIRAYFDTAGFRYDDESLEQRLKAYGAEHFVDPRTALRRSDRGAERLSFIIRDSYVDERPWGHFSIVQDGPLVYVRLEIALDSHSKFRRPFLSINDGDDYGGQDVDRTNFDLHETVQNPDRLSAVYRHPPVEFIREPEPGIPPFRSSVHWQMPVWPTWVLVSQLSDTRLHAELTVSRNNRATISIDWNTNDPEIRARPFAFLEKDNTL